MDAGILASTLVSGILLGGLYGIISIGLALVFGIMGIVNFAHGAFLMLAMYVALTLSSFLGLALVVPVTAIVMFVFGMGIQKGLIDRVLKGPELSQLLLTAGLLVVLESAVQLVWNPVPTLMETSITSSYTRVFGLPLGVPQLLTFVAAIASLVVLQTFLSRTRVGKAIKATGDNKDAVPLFGINPGRIFVLTLGICSAILGVAGALIVTFIPVYPTVGDLFLLTAFVVMIMGGVNSFTGSMLSGIIIGVMQSFTAVLFSSQLEAIPTFILFVLLLLFRPSGLFGTFGSK